MKTCAPDYPDILKRADIEGIVQVNALVDENGIVQDVKLIKSIPIVDSVCIEAAKKWKFQPGKIAIQDSNYIYYKFWFPITFHFPSDSSRNEAFKKGETYVRALIDKSGQLLILNSDAKETVMQKDSEQVGFDKIAISEDGHSVGWLTLYPNPGTSYPIPLTLKIYSNGDLHEFTGGGLPIFDWHFTAGGKQVACESETLHGGFGIHYELREVATGRLIAEYSPEYGPDNRLLEIQKNVPKWVEELDEKR
jgi:TonB family protein